jgi:hypothetical protein
MYDVTFVLKIHVAWFTFLENNTKYVIICHYLFLVDEYSINVPLVNTFPGFKDSFLADFGDFIEDLYSGA